MLTRAATLAVIATCFSGSVLAGASGYRCGDGKMAWPGDSKSAVLMKCGAPMMKERVASRCSVSGATADCRNVDEWTYNPGPGQFLTTVIFEGSKMVDTQLGARVPE